METLENARARAAAQTLRLSDGVTAYHFDGNPEHPCVVMVHGVLTPSFSWEPLSRALVSAGFCTLRYDHFGRGLSDRPATRYEPALYQRQLRELLDALGLSRVHLMGWSMGAVICSAFATAHPERVRSLVLIAPGLFVPKPRLLRLVHALSFGDSLIAGRVGRFIDALAGQQFREPARFKEFSARAREQLAFAGLGEAFASTLRHYPWDAGADFARLAHHGRPVLLVWGTRDPTTPYRNLARVQALFPRAELLTLEGARHAPHIEHAAEAEAKILSFLRAAREAD